MEKSYKYWIYHYRISIELFGRYVIAYYFEQLWVKYQLSKQYCIFIKVSWLHIRLAILMELYGNTLFMLGTSCEFYCFFSIIIVKLLYLNIIIIFKYRSIIQKQLLFFFYKDSVFFGSRRYGFKMNTLNFFCRILYLTYCYYTSTLLKSIFQRKARE